MKKYYINRLIRIIPLYYLVIIYFFIKDTIIQFNYDVPVDIYKIGWLRFFAFLNIFIPNTTDYWSNVGGTWTIFVFLLFYILFPVIRKFAVSIRRSIVLWIGAFIISFISNFDCINDAFPIVYMHYFLLGILIYQVWKKGQEIIFIWAGIILILCREVVYPIMDMFVLILLLCILVISSKWIEIDNRIGKKVIDKLDEYSFCIYLIHPIVMELAGELYNLGMQMIATIGGTLIMSVFAHELFEKPVQKKLKQILLK